MADASQVKFSVKAHILSKYNVCVSGWPAGTYGLPKTDTGCPVAARVEWSPGYKFHDTVNGNQWSSGIHFDTGYEANNMKQHFCMKTDNGGLGDWPRGSYCIFKKGICPSGVYYTKI